MQQEVEQMRAEHIRLRDEREREFRLAVVERQDEEAAERRRAQREFRERQIEAEREVRRQREREEREREKRANRSRKELTTRIERAVALLRTLRDTVPVQDQRGRDKLMRLRDRLERNQERSHMMDDREVEQEFARIIDDTQAIELVMLTMRARLRQQRDQMAEYRRAMQTRIDQVDASFSVLRNLINNHHNTRENQEQLRDLEARRAENHNRQDRLVTYEDVNNEYADIMADTHEIEEEIQQMQVTLPQQTAAVLRDDSRPEGVQVEQLTPSLEGNPEQVNRLLETFKQEPMDQHSGSDDTSSSATPDVEMLAAGTSRASPNQFGTKVEYLRDLNKRQANVMDNLRRQLQEAEHDRSANFRKRLQSRLKKAEAYQWQVQNQIEEMEHNRNNAAAGSSDDQPCSSTEAKANERNENVQRAAELRARYEELDAELKATQRQLMKAEGADGKKEVLNKMGRLMLSRDAALRECNELEDQLLRDGVSEAELGRKELEKYNLDSDEVHGAAEEASQMAAEANEARQQELDAARTAHQPRAMSIFDFAPRPPTPATTTRNQYWFSPPPFHCHHVPFNRPYEVPLRIPSPLRLPPPTTTPFPQPFPPVPARPENNNEQPRPTAAPCRAHGFLGDQVVRQENELENTLIEARGQLNLLNTLQGLVHRNWFERAEQLILRAEELGFSYENMWDLIQLLREMRFAEDNGEVQDVQGLHQQWEAFVNGLNYHLNPTLPRAAWTGEVPGAVQRKKSAKQREFERRRMVLQRKRASNALQDSDEERSHGSRSPIRTRSAAQKKPIPSKLATEPAREDQEPEAGQNEAQTTEKRAAEDPISTVIESVVKKPRRRMTARKSVPKRKKQSTVQLPEPTQPTEEAQTEEQQPLNLVKRTNDNQSAEAPKEKSQRFSTNVSDNVKLRAKIAQALQLQRRRAERERHNTNDRDRLQNRLLETNERLERANERLTEVQGEVQRAREARRQLAIELETMTQRQDNMMNQMDRDIDGLQREITAANGGQQVPDGQLKAIEAEVGGDQPSASGNQDPPAVDIPPESSNTSPQRPSPIGMQEIIAKCRNLGLEKEMIRELEKVASDTTVKRKKKRTPPEVITLSSDEDDDVDRPECLLHIRPLVSTVELVEEQKTDDTEQQATAASDTTEQSQENGPQQAASSKFSAPSSPKPVQQETGDANSDANALEEDAWSQRQLVPRSLSDGVSPARNVDSVRRWSTSSSDCPRTERVLNIMPESLSQNAAEHQPGARGVIQINIHLPQIAHNGPEETGLHENERQTPVEHMEVEEAN